MCCGKVELITFGMTCTLVLSSVVEVITPIVIGVIDIPRDNYSYLKSTWIIFVYAVIALFASPFVMFIDLNGSRVLHNTPDEQKLADTKLAEENDNEETRGLNVDETPNANAGEAKDRDDE